MTNTPLKRSDGGRYCQRVDSSNDYAGARALGGVPAITAHHATNGGPHFLGVFESPHKVGADVFRSVTPANGKNEDHIGFIQPRATKPVGVARFPALIVHPRCEFGNIV